MATEGCWIEIFEDEDYQDSSLILHGPAEYSDMKNLPGAAGKDWGDQIDSLRTGPNCWVIAYEDENYQDQKLVVGPGSSLPHLGSMGDNIDSIRIYDHQP